MRARKKVFFRCASRGRVSMQGKTRSVFQAFAVNPRRELF
ncbi:hypothetical protein HSB1_24660 [Halogranum salarium B-1]|uniref:Uncharacterized protein n=1 Tax=Halogranum salarium B-1 TaxID=1210908 RepID=J2ZEE9_9EURY|nr:hypothetical protein HSB1_24660 [Halogranum salarium B-1]